MITSGARRKTVQYRLLATTVVLTAATAALGGTEALRFGQVVPPNTPTGETFPRITGLGPFFVYGIEADDGIKKQSVSFVVAPINDVGGEVDVRIVDLPIQREVQVDPDGDIDALGEGALMVVDFETASSDTLVGEDGGDSDQTQDDGMTRVPVIYWPWWAIDYDDGGVGAEGTRILCLFGFSDKYTDGKKMVVVLLEGGAAIAEHPLLPDGYLEITREGFGYELEWGTNAVGDDKLSVNGDEVDASSTFKPKRWKKLIESKARTRALELLGEHKGIRKSPTAKH
jgi:hypothetical protein